MDESIVAWMEVLLHGWKYYCNDGSIIALMEVLLHG